MGPTSIIRLFYVMVIILVFCVFTTIATGWQHQFVSTAFNTYTRLPLQLNFILAYMTHVSQN